MVETAAGLVEHVFPHVPVRQWVLSFPWPLRLQAPGAVGTATQVTKRLTATRDGFSLNAALASGAWERKKLQRLWRYVARPRSRSSGSAATVTA